jgi:Xaa-Pro dipeptidase
VQKRLQLSMARHGLDAIVAYSKENVTYTAGYVVPSMAVGIRNRQFAVAINRDGQAAMLLSANELTEAKTRASGVTDLRPYDEFNDDPMVVLAGILGDLGVLEGKVGLELDAIPADRWERLKTLAPRATWVDGGPALLEARMVKSPRELDLMRRVTNAAQVAQAEAHKVIHEGMTERELGRLIIDGALANGAESILMVQVGAGERSGFSNPTPTDRAMCRGEIVKVDVSVTVEGYLSDTGRGFVVGEATPFQRDQWARVAETIDLVEAAVKPGVTSGDLWRLFVANFAKYGMPLSVRFLGHGLGLSVHEEPFMAAHTETVFEPGMTFAIEPVHREPDGTAYFLEDNLALTATGLENMTALLGHDLIVVG